MFTEGLDSNAVRWIQEEHAPIPKAQQRGQALRDIKNSGWGIDIPAPGKFRSGHLPSGTIPFSYVAPVEGDSDLGSNMDETSDTEESSSSPHDGILTQSLRADANHDHYRSMNSVSQQHYSSDMYSGYSSSRDTAQQRPLKPRKTLDVTQHDEEEEEWSDSGDSLGFNGNCAEDSACCREDTNSTADTDSGKGNLSNIPSAPPFNGYDKETSQDDVEVISKSAYCCTPVSEGLNEVDAPCENKTPDKHSRTTPRGLQNIGKSSSLPSHLPKFHASEQGPWHCVLAYEACVRLCLHSWARGCMEAPSFLENECALMRKAFGLQQILLQSDEELLRQQSSGLTCEGVITKPKKIVGKVKVQVHKIRMSPDMPSGCSISALSLPMAHIKSLQCHMSSLNALLTAEWKSLCNFRILRHLHASSSSSGHNLSCARYIKNALTSFGITCIKANSSYGMTQEAYTCRLKLKSTIEEEVVPMNPGSGEAHAFFPNNIGDDLYIDVYDSKAKSCGRVVVQVASISDASEKTRWWPIYLEPEHLHVGRMQICLSYTSSSYENNSKCGSIAETIAYDVVMEVAMKAQQFQQRNLVLHGSWKWLLREFATYFGVSDAYTKLRYLSYVMDVATPTSDCLMLVHDLILPVIAKSDNINRLSYQENRILGEMKEQIDHVISMVFENYKSLDESSISGLADAFGPPNGNPAPALTYALKLYTLLHDILSPEAQLLMCNYFQVAIKKRSRRYMLETDEIFVNNTEGMLVDFASVSSAYQKMKILCCNIGKEINTDIEIHNHHVLPSFIDLPNIAASIYSVELCTRLRSFLKACPPAGPSPHVTDLVIATADFQKDLASWSICPVKGGIDAKELFHLYIILWIQDKRLVLLESCKLEKVKWSGVRTQHLTTPFVEDVYDHLKETLNEYEIIMCRWPEYILVLENAIADVEKAMVETLEKQYADILAPLKDNMTLISFGLKCVKKLAKGKNVSPYNIPDELGIFLNTMKRLLDVLRPKIEQQLKSWISCIPDAGSTVTCERLSEISVTVRSKYRNYLQAVVEKLAENTRTKSITNIKKILRESKGVVAESDVRKNMQHLRDHLTKTINHIYKVFEVNVFVSVCRCLWDRLGKDVLKFLEKHKENRSFCKASRASVVVLDEIFASQMQQLLGNTLQENDLEPPRSIIEVRSILCKDVQKDTTFNYRVRA